jgi:hypothetical protein
MNRQSITKETEMNEIVDGTLAARKLNPTGIRMTKDELQPFDGTRGSEPAVFYGNQIFTPSQWEDALWYDKMHYPRKAATIDAKAQRGEMVWTWVLCHSCTGGFDRWYLGQKDIHFEKVEKTS